MSGLLARAWTNGYAVVLDLLACYVSIQNGEAWATCSFTLTGKNPERPVYKTTTMNTWPSKLRNWKYYNTKKRGGMWIPAHKDFHIDEACKWTVSHCQTYSD